MSDLKRLLVIGGLLSLLAHGVAFDLWRATHRGSLQLNSAPLTARLVVPVKTKKAAQLPTPIAPPVRPVPSTSPAPTSSVTKTGAALQDAAQEPSALATPPAIAPGNSGIRPWTEAENLIVYRLALANSATGGWPVATGEGGRVVLGLSVNEHGMASDARLVGSSDDGAFDQAALVWLQRAAKLAPLPEGLRGQAFEMELVLDRHQASTE